MYCLIVLTSVIACTLGAILPRGLIPMPDGRIVGGVDTPIEHVPWQVSMVYFGAHRCGGSIISDKIIITAAHCTVNTNTAFHQIRAGVTGLTGGNLNSVKQIVNHPNYNPNTIDFDLAIMWLSTPLTFSHSINKIYLPSQGFETETGAVALISGWGTTSEGGSLPPNLKSVQIPVISQETCQIAYNGVNKITSRMICAGVPEGGKDACQGDSGGPMVINNELVGVVSWGVGCARETHPGVYARVSEMRDWIDRTIQ